MSTWLRPEKPISLLIFKIENSMILKGKTLLGCLFVLLLVSCSQHNKQKQSVQEKTEEIEDTSNIVRYDWNPPAYRTVKAYLLKPHLIGPAANLGMANEPKEFFDKIQSEEGVVLSEAQIARVFGLFTFHVGESKVDSVEDSVNGLADCFDPRHAIVYYNEQEEPVAAIVACFECGRLCTYPRFEEEIELNSYLSNFHPFFEELNMPIFSNPLEYNAYMDSLQKVEKIKK